MRYIIFIILMLLSFVGQAQQPQVFTQPRVLVQIDSVSNPSDSIYHIYVSDIQDNMDVYELVDVVAGQWLWARSSEAEANCQRYLIDTVTNTGPGVLRLVTHNPDTSGTIGTPQEGTGIPIFDHTPNRDYPIFSAAQPSLSAYIDPRIQTCLETHFHLALDSDIDSLFNAVDTSIQNIEIFSISEDTIYIKLSDDTTKNIVIKESVEDIVGNLVGGGSGISVVYNDGLGTLTITATDASITNELQDFDAALMIGDSLAMSLTQDIDTYYVDLNQFYQTLSIDGSFLTISDGNTVQLPAGSGGGIFEAEDSTVTPADTLKISGRDVLFTFGYPSGDSLVVGFDTANATTGQVPQFNGTKMVWATTSGTDQNLSIGSHATVDTLKIDGTGTDVTITEGVFMNIPATASNLTINLDTSGLQADSAFLTNITTNIFSDSTLVQLFIDSTSVHISDTAGIVTSIDTQIVFIIDTTTGNLVPDTTIFNNYTYQNTFYKAGNYLQLDSTTFNLGGHATQDVTFLIGRDTGYYWSFNHGHWMAQANRLSLQGLKTLYAYDGTATPTWSILGANTSTLGKLELKTNGLPIELTSTNDSITLTATDNINLDATIYKFITDPPISDLFSTGTLVIDSDGDIEQLNHTSNYVAYGNSAGGLTEDENLKFKPSNGLLLRDQLIINSPNDDEFKAGTALTINADNISGGELAQLEYGFEDLTLYRLSNNANGQRLWLTSSNISATRDSLFPRANGSKVGQIGYRSVTDTILYSAFAGASAQTVNMVGYLDSITGDGANVYGRWQLEHRTGAGESTSFAIKSDRSVWANNYGTENYLDTSTIAFISGWNSSGQFIQIHPNYLSSGSGGGTQTLSAGGVEDTVKLKLTNSSPVILLSTNLITVDSIDTDTILIGLDTAGATVGQIVKINGSGVPAWGTDAGAGGGLTSFDISKNGTPVHQIDADDDDIDFIESSTVNIDIVSNVTDAEITLSVNTDSVWSAVDTIFLRTVDGTIDTTSGFGDGDGIKDAVTGLPGGTVTINAASNDFNITNLGEVDFWFDGAGAKLFFSDPNNFYWNGGPTTSNTFGLTHNATDNTRINLVIDNSANSGYFAFQSFQDAGITPDFYTEIKQGRDETDADLIGMYFVADEAFTETSPVVAFTRGVQSTASAFTYQLLRLEFDDETGDNITFYDNSYAWDNATPSVTLNDTSIHVWIGGGATTTPAFVEIANFKDGTGTDDQNLSVSPIGTDTILLAIESGTGVPIIASGITTISELTNDTILITSTEVDGSTSNEIQVLSVGGVTDSIDVDLSLGGGKVVFVAGGINSITELPNDSIKITATEVDGSTTNEIQTIDVSTHDGTGLHLSLLNDAEATKDIPIISTDANNDIIFSTDGVYLDVGTASIETVTFAVRNETGATIPKGMPVCNIGWDVTNIMLIDTAKAINSDSMPAIGLLQADLANNTNGTVVVSGLLSGFDTDGPGGGFIDGDPMYVAENGDFTNTKPAGTNLVQKIGIILDAHNVNGVALILGAGRTNDLPNIADNNIWMGNASGTPTAFDLLGGAQTRIAVTETGSQIDFVVNADLSLYSNATSNFFDVAGTGATSTGSIINVIGGEGIKENANDLDLSIDLLTNTETLPVDSDSMAIHDQTDNRTERIAMSDLKTYFADGTGTDDQTLTVDGAKTDTIGLTIESGNTVYFVSEATVLTLTESLNDSIHFALNTDLSQYDNSTSNFFATAGSGLNSSGSTVNLGGALTANADITGGGTLVLSAGVNSSQLDSLVIEAADVRIDANAGTLTLDGTAYDFVTNPGNISYDQTATTGTFMLTVEGDNGNVGKTQLLEGEGLDIASASGTYTATVDLSEFTTIQTYSTTNAAGLNINTSTNNGDVNISSHGTGDLTLDANTGDIVFLDLADAAPTDWSDFEIAVLDSVTATQDNLNRMQLAELILGEQISYSSGDSQTPDFNHHPSGSVFFDLGDWAPTGASFTINAPTDLVARGTYMFRIVTDGTDDVVFNSAFNEVGTASADVGTLTLSSLTTNTVVVVTCVCVTIDNPTPVLDCVVIDGQ